MCQILSTTQPFYGQETYATGFCIFSGFAGNCQDVLAKLQASMFCGLGWLDLKKPQLPSQHCWVTNHMKLDKLVEAHQAATALKSKRESTVSLVKLSSHHSKAFSNNSPLELENTSPGKLSRSLREGFPCILVIGSRCWKRLISSKYRCFNQASYHTVLSYHVTHCQNLSSTGPYMKKHETKDLCIIEKSLNICLHNKSIIILQHPPTGFNIAEERDS